MHVFAGLGVCVVGFLVSIGIHGQGWANVGRSTKSLICFVIFFYNLFHDRLNMK